MKARAQTQRGNCGIVNILASCWVNIYINYVIIIYADGVFRKDLP